MHGYTQVILCFAGSSHSAMVQNLQEGLCIATSQLPSSNGEVIPAKESSQLGRFEPRSVNRKVTIEVNDLTASLEDRRIWDYEELRRTGFPIAAMRNDVLMTKAWPPAKEMNAAMPVAAVQANLITGGLLLSLHIHNLYGDAGGIIPFLGLWSQACRLSEDPLPQIKSQLYVPSRRVLDQDPMSRCPKKIWNEHDTQWSHLPEMTMYNSSCAGSVNPDPIEVEIFSFSRASLNALKFAASPRHFFRPQPDNTVISTNNALKALLWRSIVAARVSDNRGTYRTTLNIPINCRSRMTPALPQDIIDNAVVVTTVDASLDTLLTFNSSTLASLALLIQQSESSINAEYVDNITSFTEAVPDLDALTRARANTYAGAIKIFGDASIGINHLYWGTVLGATESLRHPRDIFTDGRAQILPPLNDDILEVAIGLSRAHMKWLKRDELFARYANIHGGSDVLNFSGLCYTKKSVRLGTESRL